MSLCSLGNAAPFIRPENTKWANITQLLKMPVGNHPEECEMTAGEDSSSRKLPTSLTDFGKWKSKQKPKSSRLDASLFSTLPTVVTFCNSLYLQISRNVKKRIGGLLDVFLQCLNGFFLIVS